MSVTMAGILRVFDLRPANSKVRSAHAIDLRRLLNPMQVQNESAERCVVRIGESIDQCMHRVSPHGLIINSCSVDVLGVEFPSKEWIRKLAEELLQ